jgi:XTP/dITP diphosphohydrolase
VSESATGRSEPPGEPTTLLFATTNRGKVAELRALVEAARLPVRLVTLSELPPLPTVDEDAPTFEGNAEKKARAALLATGLPTLADDSGLEVDALGGAPGVLSARYAADETGARHDDAANNAKLLRALADVPDERRTARFRCALVFVAPDGGSGGASDGPATTRAWTATGSVEGRISRSPVGSHGFGYDPLFVVTELPGGRTMAELSTEEKNRLSHRGRAMAALVDRLASALASRRQMP